MMGFFQDHEIADDGDVFTQLTKHKTEKPDLSRLRGKRVHNMSLGLLDSYFNLGAFLQNGKAYVYKNRGIVMKGRQGICKTFLYESNPADLEDMKRLQNMSLIYTIEEFDKLPKRNSFMETLYDLQEVFDEKSYPNAKKRYQRLKLPLKWLESKQIQFFALGPEHDEEVEVLHEKWKKYKMEQPATYKILFPPKRYLHCTHLLTRPELNVLKLNYRGWGWRDPQTNELWGVRVMYIEDDTAYDLAFYCNQWSAPSQLSNHVNLGIMNMLRLNGLRYLNCGSNVNKGLKDFKHHYPFIDYKSFYYSSLTGAMKAKKPPKVVSKKPVAKEGPLPLGGPAEASKTTKRPAKEKQLFFDLIAAGRYTRQEIMQKLLEANPDAPEEAYSNWLTRAKNPKHSLFKWKVIVGEDGTWRFE